MTSNVSVFEQDKERAIFANVKRCRLTKFSKKSILNPRRTDRSIILRASGRGNKEDSSEVLFWFFVFLDIFEVCNFRLLI